MPRTEEALLPPPPGASVMRERERERRASVWPSPQVSTSGRVATDSLFVYVFSVTLGNRYHLVLFKFCLQCRKIIHIISNNYIFKSQQLSLSMFLP